MPATQGLIHKGGVLSGPALRGMSKDDATETARRLLAGLGLGPKDLGKLADVPADKILAIQMASEKGEGALKTPTKEWAASHPAPANAMQAPRDPAGSWAPVVDGTYLPRNPFDPDAPAAIANVPLLIGNTRDEAIFFQRDNPAFFSLDEAGLKALGRQFFGDGIDPIVALYKRTRPNATAAEIGIAVMTAVSFGNDTTLIADRKAQQPAPVYRYRYDFESNTPIKGTTWTFRAGHASDISMFFYNYEFKDLQGQGQPGMKEASQAMSGYFTSFARSAAPTAAGQPAWPRYDTTNRPVMLINSKCRVVNDPDAEERKFWQSMGR
jgi:para-nitrobenzyl esterase